MSWNGINDPHKKCERHYPDGWRRSPMGRGSTIRHHGPSLPKYWRRNLPSFRVPGGSTGSSSRYQRHLQDSVANNQTLSRILYQFQEFSTPSAESLFRFLRAQHCHDSPRKKLISIVWPMYFLQDNEDTQPEHSFCIFVSSLRRRTGCRRHLLSP